MWRWHLNGEPVMVYLRVDAERGRIWVPKLTADGRPDPLPADGMMQAVLRRGRLEWKPVAAPSGDPPPTAPAGDSDNRT